MSRFVNKNTPALHVAVGVGGGLLLLWFLTKESRQIMAPVAGSLSINPYKWGNSKQPMLMRWNAGDVGNAMRRMVPLAWPGVPFEAFMGFCANGSSGGSVKEDTALPPPYGVNNSFHEIGIFGIEAGNRSDSVMGTFPGIPIEVPLAPTSSASNNNYRRLATSDAVRAVLGRAASTELNGWINVEDQTAVGLINLRSARLSINSLIGSAASADPSSLWAVATAFGAWSAGVSGFARHVNRFRSSLDVPEAQRWGALLRAVAAAVEAGSVSGSRHSNAAYSVMRTWQKLDAGRRLATSIGGRPGWFDTGLGADEARIAAVLDAAYKRAS